MAQYDIELDNTTVEGGTTKGEAEVDVEKLARGDDILINNDVVDYSWSGITVTVEDRITKKPKEILSNISGHVKAGEMLALMGPSGSGKTTLLNVLAHRVATSSATVQGDLRVNGQAPTLTQFRALNSYVEQEDVLLGSLTVYETLDFAARIALPRSFSPTSRTQLIKTLLQAFGLASQSSTLIGTPIRKGISGGQKRRVSVASQLITGPRILFLDELTSGLDSVASYEVVSCVRQLARKNNLVVVASIHQPSTATFRLFDSLLLLSNGRTCYQGAVDGVAGFFESAGYPMPLHINPAEFILDAVNVDFAPDREAAQRKLAQLQVAWAERAPAHPLSHESTTSRPWQPLETPTSRIASRRTYSMPLILLHRLFLKSYRDVVAYGIRLAMYTGLAIMMGTVWLRLDASQASIQPFINALFFGSAFMSFMAVAYVPAYLEDRALYVKECANGLYGPTSFLVANFLIGLPYLFAIAVVFSVIAYWLIGLRPTAMAFCTWVMWLFLDLVAAESLVVLVGSLVPVFVVALAATAFANGLWMSVGGFLVTPGVLNVFWRYVFHYVDYQTYVFQGMMVNEFSHRTYTCAPPPPGSSTCNCMYPSDLASQCKIDGKAVLEVYNYAQGSTGKWVGFMLAIIVFYRLAGWVALWARRT